MKRLLVGLVLLAAVFIVAAVSFLLLVDLGRFRAGIEDIASDALGRELRLAGPLSIDLGPTIHIMAEGITLTNPEWAEDRLMLRAGRVELEVDARTLLDEQIIVRRVHADDVSVDLEQNAAGEANWEFPPSDEDDRDPPGETQGQTSLPLRIEEILLSDMRIEFSGPMVGAPVVAAITSLREEVTDTGALVASLGGQLNGEPMDLRLEVRDVVALEQLAAVDLSLTGAIGKIDIEASAATAQLLTLSEPRADVRIHGPSFRYLTDLIQLRSEADGPLNLEARLASSEGMTTLEFEGGIASIELNGSGQLPDMNSLAGAHLDLAVKGENLAGFENMLGLPAGSPGPFDLSLALNSDNEGESTATLRANALGAGLNATGRLENFEQALRDSTVEARVTVTDLQQTLAMLAVEAPVRGGAELTTAVTLLVNGLRAETLMVSLGENRLNATADVSMTDDEWRVSLPFEVAFDDVAALLDDETAASLPPAAQRIAAKGTLQASPLRTELHDVTSRLGDVDLRIDAGWPTENPLANPELELLVKGERIGEFVPEIPGNLDSPFSLRSQVSLEGETTVVGNTTFSAKDMDVALGSRTQIDDEALPTELTIDLRVVGSDLAGTVSFRQEDVPVVDARLRSEVLDLRPWIPESKQVTSDEPAQTPATGSDDGRVIPDMAVTEIALPVLRATLDLQVGRVETPIEYVEDLKIRARATPQQIDLEQLAFQGQGDGRVESSLGFYQDTSPPEAWLRFTGEKISVGLPAQDPQEAAQLPRYDASLAYVATGSTLREMAAGSHGYLRFVSGPGKLDTRAMNLFTNDFMLELLDAVNPLSKKDPYTNIRCSVLLASIEQGQLNGDPLMVLESERLRIVADTSINLATEDLDADFNTVPRKGLGIGLTNLINPYVKVGGTLAEPTLALDSSSALVSGGAALATGGLSILAKGMFDRLAAEEDACASALAAADMEFDRLEQRYGKGSARATIP